MNKIYYPAVFHPEEVGFSVFVPDVQGCATQGDTLEEATEMALDAIGLCLEETKDFPTPSLPSSIQTEPGDFVALVPFDALEYQKKYSSRAVKKTLTIPAWLNSLAEEHHVNFSSVLQSALKQLNNQLVMIELAIEEIPDDLFRAVAKLRIIGGLSWNDVNGQLGGKYTVDGLSLIHI